MPVYFYQGFGAYYSNGWLDCLDFHEAFHENYNEKIAGTLTFHIGENPEQESETSTPDDYCDLTLFKNFMYPVGYDTDAIYADIVYNVAFISALGKHNIVSPKPPSRKAHLYLRQIYETNSICEWPTWGVGGKDPVVDFVGDRERQAWFFGQQGNKHKTLEDFISYAEKLYAETKFEFGLGLCDFNAPRRFDRQGFDVIGTQRPPTKALQQGGGAI